MRIQSRLFVTTVVIVVALIAVQWVLHVQQLRALQEELAHVATKVGEGILRSDISLAGEPGGGGFAVVEERRVFNRPPGSGAGDDEGVESGADGPAVPPAEVRVIVLSGVDAAEIPGELARSVPPAKSGAADPPGEDGRSRMFVWHTQLRAEVGAPSQSDNAGPPRDAARDAAGLDAEHRVVELRGEVREVELKVEAGARTEDRYLVVSGGPAFERRIPIPASASSDILQSTLKQSLVAGLGLLAVGFVASAVMAGRLARPLQRLAERADALGHGELGVQVEATAGGEIGDLQAAFNRMSARLAVLEAERETWRQREHLAQLGDVARGLAHTLRNPLHTLGLAVEELSDDDAGRQDLADTARAQIRRIDRWLRSFLALGAADAAELRVEDLSVLVEDVALEAMQQGVTIELAVEGRPLPVRMVPSAVRAAVANLLENAAQAAPAGTAVVVVAKREEGSAVISIADRGPGLPDEVRRRLFEPHTTTKQDGSGMGLFLARQLVVGMHGGRLEVTDGAEGGTVARILVPICGGGHHGA